MKHNFDTTDELRELVQYLIANLGHPVGMGLTITDGQADKLIELVRKYDAEASNVQAQAQPGNMNRTGD